jgi:hypothetical protein
MVLRGERFFACGRNAGPPCHHGGLNGGGVVVPALRVRVLLSGGW